MSAQAKSPSSARAVSPPLTALAGWLIPGAGYWMIGARTRGTTIGVVVLLLFIMGLLIGGVRSLEVPLFDKLGGRLDRTLLDEIRAKPWSIAQVMLGPIGLAGAWGSVTASIPDPSRPLLDPERSENDRNPHQSIGDDSHSRVNEIAVLYTAVAGMLNLLAIIDSAHRAGQMQEGK